MRGARWAARAAAVSCSSSVNAVVMRRRAGHDVALHVAAGPERGQQAGVDAGDGLLEIRLEDAVELNALPRGEAQGAVGVLPGQLVHGQILLRRHPAAGDLAADHEHVMLADALLRRALRASRSSCW